jgi:negative regulator of sigma E activity
MSEELLSALMDGECSPGEVKRLMEEIGRSPALQQRWSRMCLVREALQGTQVQAAAPDFCAGVMGAIARDQAAAAADRPAKVVSLPARSRPAAANAARWQPFAGLAVAASVAAVAAVGGYRWLSQPVGAAVQTAQNTASGAQPVAYAQSAGDAGSAEGQLTAVSLNGSGSAEPVETRWSQLDAATVQQLNEYMMEHANMRAEQGVSGALSYPRMTLHSAEYRSGERH